MAKDRLDSTRRRGYYFPSDMTKFGVLCAGG